MGAVVRTQLRALDPRGNGLTLFEYQNRTTLTSNVLAWAIAPDAVVGVTSRELSNVELLEWIPLIAARP